MAFFPSALSRAVLIILFFTYLAQAIWIDVDDPGQQNTYDCQHPLTLPQLLFEMQPRLPPMAYNLFTMETQAQVC